MEEPIVTGVTAPPRLTTQEHMVYRRCLRRTKGFTTAEVRAWFPDISKGRIGDLLGNLVAKGRIVRTEPGKYLTVAVRE